MAITIPDVHYIGINLNRTSKDIPLGFLTPGGTNAAAKKRISTVNQWVGKNGVQHHHILESEAEQFEKDNPDAEFLRDAHGRKYYKTPKKEGIDYKILDNVPNEPQYGFRITQMVARYGSWNGGNKLVRIEDPRGFELEISVDNLVKVMSMTTFVEGVCQTECVWGRDGANNVLLPVNSEPYESARATTDYRNKEAVSLRDVQIGDIVELKKTEQFEGLTGQYFGAYNIYYLRNLSEVVKEGRTYYGRKPDYEMMKTAKRYIIGVCDPDGNFLGYRGVASAKIHKIVKRVDAPLDRPDIDAKDFKDISSNTPGHPIALSIKKFKVEDITDTYEFVPVDLETVEAAAKDKSSGPLSVWAKDPKTNNMMRYYRDYKSPWGSHNKEENETKAERDKVFTGQVTKIYGDKNKWEITASPGQGGFGVFHILKHEGSKAALVVNEYDWYQLTFKVGDTQRKVPIRTEQHW